ncbi:hypothetical protein [Burkholderia multivorans]|uniref:hypothetical protein n=1 Tax=Burkholderia multivorans TaxID=87883 RepID=UPI000AFF84CA|nr:hypothetical protein [Burkholderia multivorans]MBU9242158.1 hypothetical protein [Burkholderia multivorans]MBU9258711.1 hypothetical protein [Burkholderia multivorans]MDN7761005.1 hypothetical protein [Burkholderia multivorans]MDN8104249.1 hypothetical protein [Burkholderia multivorans]HEF4751403.1 hypothetical protein [Burkholderia multivorans]
MGFDISYHPMREAEIQTCFFDLRRNRTARAEIFDRFQLDARSRCAVDQLLDIEFEDSTFNNNLGFCLAAVAGYYRKYWYLRGGACSFVIEKFPEFARYTRSRSELIPPGLLGEWEDTLSANYQVGCYLSEAGVVALLSNLDRRPSVVMMDETFSHGRLAVFRQALAYAAEHHTGLIEASEIIEPNPFNLSASGFATKADHCEMEGIALYMAAAGEHIGTAMNNKRGQLLH